MRGEGCVVLVETLGRKRLERLCAACTLWEERGKSGAGHLGVSAWVAELRFALLVARFSRDYLFILYDYATLYIVRRSCLYLL